MEKFTLSPEHVLDNAPTGIFIAGKNGECTYTNKALQNLLGLSYENSLGVGYTENFHPDDKAVVIKHWHDCVAKKKVFKSTFRIGSGPEPKLIVVLAEPLFSDNKKLLGYVGSVDDISELNDVQQALRLSQQRYELAAKGASAGIWDWNIDSDEVYYSVKFTDLLGFDNLTFGNEWESFSEQIHPEDRDLFNLSISQHFNDPFEVLDFECRIFSAKQHELWVHIVGEAIRDKQGIPHRMVGSITDVTDKKQSQQVIWHQANFDALTQLPNRNMFTDRLNQEIIKGKRTGDKFALLFIDLDHFKEVNDTLGHNAGDLLLVEVAERLRLILRQSDTVARIGGDEFTALLTNIDSVESVEHIAAKLIETIELPFFIHGESIFISASIGITFFPEHSEKMDELLRFADQAMYLSKEEGRKQYRHFSRRLQEKADRAHRLSQELRLAIIEQQFEVLYQPIYNISKQAVTKAEALIRWHHPDMGMISPADFIPIAETSGVIADIGDWVFKCAASQVKQWQAKFNKEFEISVNRSPAQFQSALEHHDRVWFNKLEELSIEKGICIEITEGLLLDDNQSVKEKLSAFQRAGMSISLDDFGTGYAALSYLTKFSIDYLKIDRAFVMNIESSEQNKALCEAIIVMAHKLGLKVIAEGVETTRQLDFLANAGCDFAQGYLISKPISAELFEQELTSCDPFNMRHHFALAVQASLSF